MIRYYATKASVELKKKKAHKEVVAAAAVATAVGASPIPFSDAAMLVPIQTLMLKEISAIFGVALPEKSLAGMVGTAITTNLGRSIVSNILKFVPGLGTVAGGLISAGTAGILTMALGETYIAVLADAARAEPAGQSTRRITQRVLQALKRG